jgi:hypothetical protein
MEYSIASSISSLSQMYQVPFPHLSSQPANDLVNPGLGQMVSLFNTIVPMRGRAIHTIEKKLERLEESEAITDKTDQIGSGKLQPEIAESFQKPIITDSIVFPKKEKVTSKRKSANEPISAKKIKVNHKFKVV